MAKDSQQQHERIVDCLLLLRLATAIAAWREHKKLQAEDWRGAAHALHILGRPPHRRAGDAPVDVQALIG
jgi:hypothetical protein